MLEHSRTSLASLQNARLIARAAGLRHVYTGNVRDLEGDTTRCGHCDTLLIERDWYELRAWNLDPMGDCPTCGTPVPGVFEPTPGTWGARRQPVSIV